jgi:hypothetical protein
LDAIGVRKSCRASVLKERDVCAGSIVSALQRLTRPCEVVSTTGLGGRFGSVVFEDL